MNVRTICFLEESTRAQLDNSGVMDERLGHDFEGAFDLTQSFRRRLHCAYPLCKFANMFCNCLRRIGWKIYFREMSIASLESSSGSERQPLVWSPWHVETIRFFIIKIPLCYLPVYTFVSFLFYF